LSTLHNVLYTADSDAVSQFTEECYFKCRSCTVNIVEIGNVLRYLVFDIYSYLYQSTNRKNTVSEQSHFFSSHITKKAYDALN
jgi:hypothetical protein